MPTVSAAQLRERAEQAAAKLAACDLCPRRCGVNRTAGELGFCGIGRRAVVASYGPHFGEERPLVGRGGSGTVFFSGCNLRCVFCQNDDISHGRQGREVDEAQLAGIFLAVAAAGCHNLNLVTPSHVAPQILGGVGLALVAGFDLPVVYNTGGYDTPETLRLLEGVVDIYMPDYKFSDPEPAERYLGAPDYPIVVRAALKEMHRQVGDLVIDDRGVAGRGLLVRHLVMPFGRADSEAALRFLAEEISPRTYTNIMDQYRPCHRARQFDELARRPFPEEMAEVYAAARRVGLTRLDKPAW